MLKNFLNTAVLLLLAAAIVGCSDDDCPTCADQEQVLFYCSVGFAPELPASGQPTLSIGAGFIGDPVPEVSGFSWFGRTLYRTDSGFPAFNGDIDTGYVKHIPVSMIVDEDSVALDIVIPEPTELLSPGGSVPPNEAVEVNWSESQDAERYFISIQVIGVDEGFIVYLDTLIFTTDTTYTIPSEYVVPGAQLIIQLGAGIGVSGEPGESANFHEGRFTGFLVGSYKAPWVIAGIRSGFAKNDTVVRRSEPLGFGR